MRAKRRYTRGADKQEMKKTFEKLQNQHPSVKTRVALTVASSVTGLIGLILLTTLPLRFQDASLAADSSNAAAVVSATGDAAGTQIQNIQDSWTQISNGLQVNQGSDTQAPADTSVASQTVVPGQDASQDTGFPSDAAQTNTQSY